MKNWIVVTSVTQRRVYQVSANNAADVVAMIDESAPIVEEDEDEEIMSIKEAES